MKFYELKLTRNRAEMDTWPDGKFLLGLVNTQSFVRARNDTMFASSLLEADALVPESESVLKACKKLELPNPPEECIPALDLFRLEMKRLDGRGGTCFFLGASEELLGILREKVAKEFPNIRVEGFCPDFKPYYTKSEDKLILDAVNAVAPDLMWVHFGTPKQEKWLYYNWEKLDVHGHVCPLGDTVDAYAGTLDRIPEKWKKLKLGWAWRLGRNLSRFFNDVVLCWPTFWLAEMAEKKRN